MKKPQLLRDHITRACPELATSPEKLTIFIERGNVLHTGTPSLSFEYRYTLNLVVTDWTANADLLVVPVIAWLKVHQPDLFANPERRAKGFRFEVEILDHEKADVAFELDLTESVAVTGGTVGGVNRLTTRHIGEAVLAGTEPPDSVLDLLAEWRVEPLDPGPA